MLRVVRICFSYNDPEIATSISIANSNKLHQMFDDNASHLSCQTVLENKTMHLKEIGVKIVDRKRVELLDANLGTFRKY